MGEFYECRVPRISRRRTHGNNLCDDSTTAILGGMCFRPDNINSLAKATYFCSCPGPNDFTSSITVNVDSNRPSSTYSTAAGCCQYGHLSQVTAILPESSVRSTRHS